jgi:hypothetical protein
LYETPPGNASSPVADPNISETFLSRFHRFIRLWRKTGWTIHELDNLISALGETDITPALMHKLAEVQNVNAILELSLLQLACFWGNIDTYGDNSPNLPVQSLYAQLFLSNSGNVTGGGTQQQSVFTPNPLGALLTSTPTPQLTDHLPEIFAALAISADDYAAIVADANLANSDLSLANLSTLYRYKLLANPLNLSVTDLCTVKSCLSGNPFAGPGDTFDFLQKVQKVQNSGFGVSVLNYILTGEFKPVDDIALTQDTIFEALPGLSQSLSKIDSDNPNPNLDVTIQAKIDQLKQEQIVSTVSSLTGLNSSTLQPVIVPAISTLISDA